MAITRINNNQITDASAGNAYVGVNAAAKLQDYTVTSGKIANNLTYGSDLTITGNLTVNGTATTIDTVNLVVEDPLILLAKEQTGSPALDIGFIGKRGTSDNIAFVWDESADQFVTVFTTDEVTNTTITISSYASLQTLDLQANTVTATANVSGGNITTGGVVAATGNVLGGNITTAGQVVATANITGGNISTAGIITATGNITGGNLVTAAGVFGATGYFTGNVDILGNLNATVGLVYANSGIIYGDATTGVDALFVGVPGFTPLGSNVISQFGANVNSYAQINFQNINAGNLASTDYIATADNGDDANYYVNMGINSSTFDDASYPGYYPNDSYLHNHGGNLILNPESSGTTIKMMVGGLGDANVVMEISNTTVTINDALDVTGNIDGGNLNTAGQVVATGNITGGNLITAGNLDVAGITTTGNISAGNIAVSGQGTFATIETTGNALIGGNLVVQGNITYINIDDLRVEDPVIILGTGPNGAPLTTDDGKDRGIFMEYYKSALGNAFVGWDNSTGNMFIASNVSIANDVITVNSYGTLQGGNLYVESVLSTGNVDGSNLNTAGQVVATGNVTGGNLNTAGQVIATANITGGNINTAGTVIATGNVDGGNLNATSAVTAGTTVTATGNVTGGNLITAGLVSAGTTVTATGNVIGGNVTTAGQMVATGNVTGGNLITAGLVSAGTTVTATGNITGGNINTAGQVVATGNITGGNLITTGTAALGNVRISGNDITGVDTEVSFNTAQSDINFRFASDNQANMLVIDAGSDSVMVATGTPVTGASFNIGATDSMIVPTGNTAQRPGTGQVGMFRFNTGGDALEVYTSTGWEDVGVPAFTVVADDQFNGDGSTVQYTLGQDSTTAATIVSINGVLQIPTTAYSVSGNVLTFTEAPEASDVIDARTITTTTTITNLENVSGNAVVETLDTSATVSITGNLLPSANVTYNLGSSTARWNELWLAGSTITLGNVVMKNVTANTIGFFGPDGTTPATLDANVEIVGDSIENGTSNVSFAGLNGNVLLVSGGTTTGTITSTGANVTGYVTATGNVTGGNIITGGQVVATGNISGGNITGTLTTAAQPNITSVGTLSSLSVTGNISGGNLSVSTGIVTLGSIVNANANGVGNIGSAGGYFNTVFAKATSAQYADLAEMYEADAEYAPGTVVCFGGDKEVTVCDHEEDTRVAGVVSTNPSYLMNSACEGEYVAAVALTGRVPCRVVGPVKKGDLMISAGNGSARAKNDARNGSIIGKALQDFNGVEGMIEVVVGRF